MIGIRTVNNIIKHLSSGYNVDLAITMGLLPLLAKLKLLPRRVKLPDGLWVCVNDLATLKVNIPDHYERRECMLHEDFIPRRGWTVVDVGAYVGIYSLWASKRVGDEGLVLAFEPNPLALQALMLNIKLNNVKNILVLPYALGDEIGTSKLFVAKENIGASSFIKDHVTKNPGGPLSIVKEYACPVVPFDYLLNLRLFGKTVEQVDLMKIDVEGYEMKVLKGSRKALMKGLVKRIVVEVHIDQVKTSEVVEYLREFGYEAVGIKRFNKIKDMLYLKNCR